MIKLHDSAHMINVKFAAHNELFKICCELADIPNTARQASKFRMGKGQAWEKRKEGIKFLEEKKNEPMV